MESVADIESDFQSVFGRLIVKRNKRLNMFCTESMKQMNLR